VDLSLDEGAVRGIFVQPNVSGALSARPAFVECDGVNVNGCSADGAVGIQLNYCDKVLIRNTWLGYKFTGSLSDALYLFECGNVTLEGVIATAKMNRITVIAPTTSLTLIDCIYTTLVSPSTTNTFVQSGGHPPPIERVSIVAASGAALTLVDVRTATIHRVTLTANCTLTFPAAVAGKKLALALVQDATGSRSVTWPAAVRWPGGTVPTLSAGSSRADYLSFVCTDGATWAGSVVGQNYADAATFAPSDLPNMDVWFKADGTLYQDSARTILAVAADDPVGSWSDASTNVRHANQATAGKRPLLKLAVANGKPGIKFDDVDDVLGTASFTAPTNRTIFFAFKRGATAGNYDILYSQIATSGDARDYFVLNTPTPTLIRWENYSSSYAPAANEVVIVSYTYDGTTEAFFINGTAKPTAAVAVPAALTASLRLGADPSGTLLFSGHLLEVLRYSDVKSTDDRRSAETYLGAKYGVTMT